MIGKLRKVGPEWKPGWEEKVGRWKLNSRLVENCYQNQPGQNWLQAKFVMLR